MLTNINSSILDKIAVGLTLERDCTQINRSSLGVLVWRVVMIPLHTQTNLPPPQFFSEHLLAKCFKIVGRFMFPFSWFIVDFWTNCRPQLERRLELGGAPACIYEKTYFLYYLNVQTVWLGEIYYLWIRFSLFITNLLLQMIDQTNKFHMFDGTIKIGRNFGSS